MVYVLSQNGKPLMPTSRHGKVRILLQNKQAKVIKRKPFTIQLLYATTEYTQPIKLGIDSGYSKIGFSATTESKELVSGEVTLLQRMSERLEKKAMYRRQRRSRKRYRKPRFNNRRRGEGWLAPSIRHKLESHVRFINYIKTILPITETIVEVANFDIQKIKDPSIEGEGYQQGEQTGFWNLREYILHRDKHKCQNTNCKNRAKEKVLQVHHIGYWRKDRSDRPSNLVTLCTKCHTPKNHQESGFLWGWKPKLKSFREATFMSTVRWRLVNFLNCKYTYGYQTKSKRIKLGLEKSHRNDAFCITSGSAKHDRSKPLFFEQVRRNNRSLEKFYEAKYIDARTGKKASGQELFSGRRTRNKNLNTENLRVYRQRKVKKWRRSIRKKRYFYQPKDLVKYKNRVFTVKGTHNKGARVILKESGKSVKVDALTPYAFRKGFAIV